MYNTPKFEIITTENEDIILTSLIDKGDVSIDDIPSYDWDSENP